MVLEMAWHYQSPSSQHQPSTHNHAGNEHLRSVTRQNRINYHTCLANIPFLCTVNTGAVIAGSQQTNSPHGQLKDAVHSPTSVRTILRFPIRASTIISVKCNCTDSPQTNSHTHPPSDQLKDAVHSPMSVRTILRFPVWASIIDVKCKCTGSPQTN